MLLFLPRNSQGGCQALLYPTRIELCPGFGAGGWGSRYLSTAGRFARTPGTAAGGQCSNTPGVGEQLPAHPSPCHIITGSQHKRSLSLAEERSI